MPAGASGALASPDGDSSAPDSQADEIVRLRQELADTRENLQAVIEELESSNEELQSLNEEVQSSTEEVHAANEELQSSNEELTTLNDELRLKSIESAQLGTTLGNIQNSIRTGLVVLDRDGKITRFNRLAVRIFGMVEDDIGQHIYGVPCHLDLPRLREQVGGVMATGESLVERVHQGDFHFLMQIDPYRNELGLIAGTVLTFADISNLHRAEQDLRDSESRYQLTVNALTEGVVLFGRDGRVLACNPSAERILRLSAAEMKALSNGLSDWRPVREDGVTPFPVDELPVARALATGESQRDVVMGDIGPDGQLVWLLVNAEPILDGVNPLPASVVVSFTDITARRRAVQALRENEQRMRLAQDAALVGTWEWFLDSDRNYWSDRIWAIYGLSPDLWEPSYQAWRESIHPDDRGRVESLIGAAVTHGREFEVEWRVNPTADEPQRWVLSRGQPVALESGRPDRYLGIVMDITERKEAEQRRLHSQLFESELKILQNLLDTSFAGYFDWNIQARTEYLSPTFKRMLGYRDDELPISQENRQGLIFEEDLPGVLERLRAARQEPRGRALFQQGALPSQGRLPGLGHQYRTGRRMDAGRRPGPHDRLSHRHLRTQADRAGPESGEGGGGSGQPRQEHLPRQHVARDPHPDECHHRADPPAPAQLTRPRISATISTRSRALPITCSRSSTTSSTSPRSRPAS